MAPSVAAYCSWSSLVMALHLLQQSAFAHKSAEVDPPPFVTFAPYTDSGCTQVLAANLVEEWNLDECAAGRKITCGCDGATKVVEIEAYTSGCGSSLKKSWSWPTDVCMKDVNAYGGKKWFMVDGGSCCECNANTSSCTVHGDPHITVFDRAEVALLGIDDPEPQGKTERDNNNMFGWGDFWLVKSQEVQIQGRYRKVYYPKAVEPLNHTYLTAVAVSGPFMAGHKLIVEPRVGTVTFTQAEGERTSLFEGVPTEEEETRFDFSDIVKAQYYNRTRIVPEGRKDAVPAVDVQLPSGVKILVDRFAKHLDFEVDMSASAGGPGGIDGQCGNFNGDATDDTAELIDGRIGGQVSPQENFFDADEADNIA